MKYVFIILLILPILEVVAQKKDPLPIWEYTTYPGNQNTDYADNKYIVKDSFGYLWTFNSSSIERFDGYNFKSYFTYDEINSENDVQFVYRLHCGKNGEVYALSSAGLSVLNRETDRFEKIMDGFEPYAEGMMADFTSMVDHDGKYYLGSFVGFYEFDPTLKEWTFYDLTPDIEHKNAHHSRKVVWLITQDKYKPHLINIFGKAIYHQFDTRSRKIVQSFKMKGYSNTSVKNVSQVSPHKFYLSTFGSGVVIINNKTEEAIPFFVESSKKYGGIPFRAVHSSGFLDNYYIATGTDDPIAFIDTTTKEVVYFNDLGSNQFDFTSFDNQIYWCTIHKGLLKIQEEPFSSYYFNIPPEKPLRKVCSNNAENLVGLFSEENYLSFYDVDLNKLVYLDDVKNSVDLYHDKFTDEFLVETARGQFSVYDGNDLSFKRKLDLSFEGGTYDYMFTKNQYIFNNYGKLNFYSKKGVLEKSIDIPEKYYTYLQLHASYLSKFDDNHLLIQNPSHLIKVNIESGTFKEYQEFRNQGLIGSYSMDGVNLYTIKSRSGLVKYEYNEKQDTFLQKEIEYALPAYTTYQNFLCNDSLIWMRSKDNVKIFNMKSEKYLMDENFSISHFSLYNEFDVSSNAVWACGADEIMKIKIPTHFKELESINLESVETNKRNIVNRGLIELQPDESTIKFHWSSPYFGNARTITYYTLLEGRDNTWERLGEVQEKLYLGLNPGDYTLFVKAFVPGSKIYQNELIKFRILPPWYQTWWFYSLLALTLIGGLYSAYRFRLEAITKKNKLEKRIAQLELKALKAQLNPHFIFNSLNSIKRLIQKNENKVAIEYLLLFSSMIRNVLDLSDKKSVTLREELEFSEKYLKMEKLRFKKNFEYEIYFDDDYFLDDYTLPAMILQPHLENAIWHGIMPLEKMNGKVYVNVFETEDFVNVRIEDNGIGRKASAEINAKMKGNIHKSKGQSLSIDRLKLTSLSREQEITTEIIDKDPNGDNPGTTVVIKIKK